MIEKLLLSTVPTFVLGSLSTVLGVGCETNTCETSDETQSINKHPKTNYM